MKIGKTLALTAVSGMIVGMGVMLQGCGGDKAATPGAAAPDPAASASAGKTSCSGKSSCSGAAAPGGGPATPPAKN